MNYDVEMVREMLSQSQLIANQLRSRLSQTGIERVTAAQIATLTQLDPGTTPAELARRLGVTRQSMQRTLLGLETAGITMLSPHPVDGRSKQVTLTGRGRELMVELERLIDGFGRRFDAAFGSESMHSMRHVLRSDWATLLATSDQNA